LVPYNWQRNVMGGLTPPIYISEVRWFGEGGPMSWEKLAAPREYLCEGSTRQLENATAEGDVVYGQKTLLTEGEKLHEAYEFLTDKAMEKEKKYNLKAQHLLIKEDCDRVL
jgi:hypothetical protein